MSRPGQNLPRNAVTIFPTTEAFFEAILGPAEPNAHVREWHWHQRSEGLKAAAARFSEQMVEDQKARRERLSFEIAERNNFNPTTLRTMYDRWATGCLSRDWNAGVQAAIHLRALDIALERTPFAQAAE